MYSNIVDVYFHLREHGSECAENTAAEMGLEQRVVEQAETTLKRLGLVVERGDDCTHNQFGEVQVVPGLSALSPLEAMKNYARRLISPPDHAYQ